MALKHCRKCDQLLPYDKFYTSRRDKDGLQGSCKACWAAAGMLRYTQIGRFHADRTSVKQAKRRGRPMKRRPYRSKHNPLGLDPEDRT